MIINQLAMMIPEEAFDSYRLDQILDFTDFWVAECVR